MKPIIRPAISRERKHKLGKLRPVYIFFHSPPCPAGHGPRRTAAMVNGSMYRGLNRTRRGIPELSSVEEIGMKVPKVKTKAKPRAPTAPRGIYTHQES